ncbi:uncharacterized protein LOC120330950 [Styela clava]
MGCMNHDHRLGIFLLAFAGFLPIAFSACTNGKSPFNLYSMSGSLKSTGYPEYYYGNERCDWSLNPPKGRVPELLIIDIVNVDTNVDGLPDAADVCYNTKNFLNLGPVRACGKEGPVCLAILMKYSSNLDCHRKILMEYPTCHSLVHSTWPLDISFQTEEADFTKAGFKLDYKFVDCSAPLTTQSTTTTVSPGAISMTYNVSAAGTDSGTTPSTVTTTTATPVTTPTARTTTTHISSTEYIEKRTLQTAKTKSTTTTRITASTKIAKDTMEPEDAGNTNMILIITLVVLLVIFLFVVIAVIFRKRLRTWVVERKDSKQLNGPPSRDGTAQYTEAYIIPIDGNYTYERPLPATEIVLNGDANGNKYDKLNEITKGETDSKVVISDGKTIENVHYESIDT